MHDNSDSLEGGSRSKGASAGADRAWVSDFELVALVQNGHTEAYAELVRRHEAECLKVALSILRHRQDAEDEVQNALMKAFQHIRQFQQQSLFSTWLVRIVVNQSLMQLRQKRRVYLLSLGHKCDGDHLSLIELCDRRPNPEQQVGHEESNTLLRSEIQLMPELLRSAVVLCDVQQLPITVAAERLGISISAAKSRLMRGRTEICRRMTARTRGLDP